MRSASTRRFPAGKRVNWTPLPDRLTEDEVEFQITAWTGNPQTKMALLRQAQRLGFDSVFEYLESAITGILLSDEEDSILADDGRILRHRDGLDEAYHPKDV